MCSASRALKGLSRHEPLLFQASDIPAHPRVIAGVAELHQIRGFNYTKLSDFDESREFGLAKKVGTISEVISAGGTIRLQPGASVFQRARL